MRLQLYQHQSGLTSPRWTCELHNLHILTFGPYPFSTPVARFEAFHAVIPQGRLAGLTSALDKNEKAVCMRFALAASALS